MNNEHTVQLESPFPEHLFNAERPAQLKQGDWLSDVEFLGLLEKSWCSQYADYIGERSASEHIEMLRAEGRLYDHPESSTIHAWVDGHIVGVTSLRSLGRIDLITMLEVHPQFRQRGIGTQLMKALCSASRCLMAHVSIHQPRVKNFYIRNGFHVLQRAHELHGRHNLEFDVMAQRTLSSIAEP